MDRTIKLSAIRDAVNDAYKKYQTADVDDASADNRIPQRDPAAFGIAVTLTDGTQIVAGDSSLAVPMTGISRVPLALTLLTQYQPMEFVEKMGMKKCCSKATPEPTCRTKPHIGVSSKGVRAMSMLQPIGDPEGKWDIYISSLLGLAGSEVEMCDETYRNLLGLVEKNDGVNTLAKDDFFLYDDAERSIDLYAKASAMRASAEQLSAIGATIAADGYNPLTKANIFDGALSQRIVALMAAKGPHKMSKPWLFLSGVPAVSSYAGTMMGVIPGVMGIAAYSPLVNGVGVSKRAAFAICDIANTLGISALGSARIAIEQD